MKQIISKITQLTILYIMLIIASYPFAAFALPEGFVYLDDVDPTVIQHLRYYTNENFVGKRLEGYKSNKVILTRQTAEALSTIQKELLKDGYSLVIYDAYRPQRTVDFFVKWAADISDQVEKEKYYPTINKADVFKLGYVAAKSGHTRGSTVDLTIIKTNTPLKAIELQKRQLTDGSWIPFLEDGTVDMGSSLDLFGEASHHDSTLIAPEFLRMRNYLRNIMKKHGFNDYNEEWWHYTLQNEPFPDTYFDFEVK